MTLNLRLALLGLLSFSATISTDRAPANVHASTADQPVPCAEPCRGETSDAQTVPYHLLPEPRALEVH